MIKITLARLIKIKINIIMITWARRTQWCRCLLSFQPVSHLMVTIWFRHLQQNEQTFSLNLVTTFLSITTLRRGNIATFPGKRMFFILNSFKKTQCIKPTWFGVKGRSHCVTSSNIFSTFLSLTFMVVAYFKRFVVTNNRIKVSDLCCQASSPLALENTVRLERTKERQRFLENVWEKGR